MPADDPSPAASSGTRYDAFISYSHAADGQLAPAVQDGLHRLARRWHELRALNVFRDTTGLAANPGLWSSIRAALDDSRYFILLASPEAARSEWVNREVEYWLTSKSASTILPVVTDGDWRWEPARSDFEPGASTAVPPALLGAFDEEPRHIDLRWARSETDLSLRHSRFRDQIAELAAPVHGLSKDQLEGEDIRRHRFVRRLTRAVGASLALLAVIALGAGVIAIGNAVQARQAQDEAEAQAQRAESEAARAEEAARQAVARSVAAQAELLDGQPDLQLLLHVAALELDPDAFTQRALLRTLLSRPLAGFWRPERPAASTIQQLAEMDPSGRRVAFNGEDGRLEIWDIHLRQRLSSLVVGLDRQGRPTISDRAPPGGAPMPISGIVAISGDRFVLATLLGDLLSWSSADGEIEVIRRDCLSRPVQRPMAASEDGTRVAISCITDPETLAEQVEVLGAAEPITISMPEGMTVSALDLTSDGSLLALVLTPADFDPISTIRFHDATSGDLIGELRIRTRGDARIRFNSDGSLLAVGGFDGSVTAIDVPDRRVVAQAPAHTSDVTALEFDGDGLFLATGDAAGGVATWRIVEGEQGDGQRWLEAIGTFTSHAGRIQAIGFQPDGAFVSIGADGMAWWDTPGSSGGERLHRTENNQTVWALAVGPDGVAQFSVPEGIMRVGPLEAEPEMWLPLESSLFKLASSADGRITAGGLQEVTIWDSDSGEVLGTVAPEAAALVWSLAIRPDGEMVAVGYLNEGGRLYDARGEEIGQFADAISVNASAFSPDGRLLAFSADTTLTLFDLERLEPLVTHGLGRFTEAITFSPDGSLLAVGTGHREGSVQLFEIERSGSEPDVALRERLVFEDPAAGVRSLAFDSTGTLMVAGTWDGRLFVVDVISGERVAITGIPRSLEVIAGVAFLSPDILVTAGTGGVIRYDWRADSLTSVACQLAGRTLTDAEQARFFGTTDVQPCL